MENIYLVITPFFPESNSFRGPFVLDQVKAIKRNSDYKVVVMKPQTVGHKLEDYEYDGIKVYRFNDYTLPSNVWPCQLIDCMSENSMFKKLDSLQIDLNDIKICHTHTTHLGHYALAIKKKNPYCKAVLQHHGFDVMKFQNGRFANYDWHKKHCVKYGVGICNTMDLNIGVSHQTLGYLHSYDGINIRKEYVLNNGVDSSIFFPVNRKKNNNFTIGCIANFWPLKCHMTLIKAVEKLKKNGYENLLLKLIGTGVTRPECEEYVKKKHLENTVLFLDEVMHHELPDFYRSLDLFVLPSYFDAFPCVFYEAYSCGVPFIGGKESGIAEVIPEGEKDFWLAEKENVDQLAKIIEARIGSCEMPPLKAPYKIDDLVGNYLKYIKVNL